MTALDIAALCLSSWLAAVLRQAVTVASLSHSHLCQLLYVSCQLMMASNIVACTPYYVDFQTAQATYQPNLRFCLQAKLASKARRHLHDMHLYYA